MFFKFRIVYSCTALVIVMLLLSMVRPKLMFKSDGSVKEFGLGEDKTLCSLSTFSVVIAMILFYFFALTDMIFAQS